MAQLAAAQQSLLRATLGSVYQTAGIAGTGPPGLRAAWSLLTTLDREQPDALATVLGHPFVRTWAMRSMEQLRAATRPGQIATGPAPGLGHLAAIAAAAAVRARADVTVTVPVADAVYLPTLGRLDIGPRQAADGDSENATVSIRGDTVLIEARQTRWKLSVSGLLGAEPGAAAGGGPPDAWQPVRKLRAAGLCVALDDTDPYRDCDHWPAAPRLADAEHARWQSLFEQAWQEIEGCHGAFAPVLGASLTTLVPLSETANDRMASTAGRHAPGAVAISRPADPVTMALLLICGFQQVKLCAVLDLYDLYDPADDRLFPAPWGEGKQHLNGLFLHTFAHLAGIDFWRVRQQTASGPPAHVAGQRSAQWRSDTLEAIQTLAGSGSLTALGTSFLEHMRRSAAR
jgi:uncharacterized protein